MSDYTPLYNPTPGDNGKRAVQLVGDFVLNQLAKHRATWHDKSSAVPPLFVGVQGPQGCGKSHLTALLPSYLQAPPHSLRLASLSLDDLYSSHSVLTSLASTHSSNKLLQGRGQPGTHDLVLGKKCLQELRKANDDPSSSEGGLELPVFDKSRYDGKGDRSEEVVKVHGPLDVVIFEGWMNGFGPIEEAELFRRYAEASKDPKTYGKEHLDYDTPFFLDHKEEDLLLINNELSSYPRELWSFLDCFVQLKPVEMSYIWEWRLQQEHAMKAKNGGIGMTDEEVKNFIARYLPGYELFMDYISSEKAPWHGNGLQLVVGKLREIVRTRTF